MKVYAARSFVDVPIGWSTLVSAKGPGTGSQAAFWRRAGRLAKTRIAPLANPAYHLRRIREDLAAFKKVLQNRQRGQVIATPEELPSVFRGKLFGSFFLSGPFAFIGVILGLSAQAATHNPWVGLFTTILGGAISSTAAYQVVWWLDNRQLYAAFPTRWARFVELQKDLWPVHSTGLKVGALFALLSIPINGGIIVLADAISPAFAARLPMGLIVAGVDLVLVQGTFLRVMGDLFDRHSRTLARKYQPALVSA